MLELNNYQKSSELFQYVFFYVEGLPLKRENYDNDCDYVMSRIMMSILDGSNEIKDDDLNRLFNFISEDYRAIATQRLNGIAKSMQREYDEAIKCYKKALEQANKKDIAGWIKRDIILDLRSIEIDRYNLGLSEDDIEVKKWNNALEKMKDYDYNLYVNKNILLEYKKLEDDLFSSYTTKPYTYITSFVSTYHYSLLNIANALIGAIYYGSYTYIHNLRNKIGTLAYIYFKESNMKELLVVSLKMLSVENDMQKVEKILETEWEAISSRVFVNPWEIISFHTKNRNHPEDISKKCVFIKHLAAFIQDQNLKEVQSFLISALSMPLSDRSLVNVRGNSIEALSKLINRLDVNIVISAVKGLLEDNKKFYREFLVLLKNTDWEKSDNKLAKIIIGRVYEYWCSIKKDFEVMEVFEAIRKAFPELLQKIDKDLFNTWLEDKPIGITCYFGLSHEKPKGVEIGRFILDLIEKINSSDEEIQQGVHIILEGFVLNDILFNYLCKKWYNPSEQVYGKLQSTYEKILLNKNQTAQKKAECIESFCRLAYYGNNRKIKFARDMNSFIKKHFEEVLKCYYKNDFASGYLESLEIKYFLLSIICGLSQNFGKILMKVIDYGENKSFIVREDVIMLVNEMLRLRDFSSSMELQRFLYSKTYDSWYKIRADAIFFLSSIKGLNKLWELYILNRMKQLIIDSNSYVRSSVILAAGKRIRLAIDVKFKNEYFEVLRTGAKDNHYKLRESAKKELKELKNQNN